MSASIEINAVDVGPKFEVNSNNISGGGTDVVLDGLAKNSTKIDGQMEQSVDGPVKKVNGDDNCKTVGMNGETETGSTTPTPNKNVGEVSVVLNGDGELQEKASGSVGDGSPKLTADESCKIDENLPLTDNCRNSPISPAKAESLDGETDSIGSGKSPKKKKGFLSGGLHLHMPKFGSRLSFGSDISAASTGSDGEGTTQKKKKKKDRKNKKRQNLDAAESQGELDNPTRSEYSESVASERVDDCAVSVTDTGLDNEPENQQEIAELSDEKTPALENVGKEEENVGKEGETAGEGGDATPQPEPEESAPSPGPEIGDKEQMEEKVTETAETEPVNLMKDASIETQPENSSEDVSAPSPMTEETQLESSSSPVESPPPLPAEPETPSLPVEESKEDTADAAQAVKSIPNPGESSPQREVSEEKAAVTDEVKTGAMSSGEEGEGEDEGETEDETQKKKKKRKGILNVHFPHFGGKKVKSGERSSDQSSDSDRALSPKRFGWRKRKDAKSPERKAEKEEKAPEESKSEDQPASTESPREGSDKQEEDVQAGAAASLGITVEDGDGASSPPEGSVDQIGTEEGGVRPEEKLLEECEEFLKEGGEDGGSDKGNEGAEFASTDALLEQIAETITSIEKAQNLRASQTMEENVSAGSTPEGRPSASPPPPPTQPAAGADLNLDLQADLAAKVDGPGIDLPSAQVPMEGPVMEVSEEEKQEVPAAVEAPDEGNEGAADVKETQGGEVVPPSPGKERSPKFKINLPKFHLPKMHLGGKKDKKKPEHDAPAEIAAGPTSDAEVAISSDGDQPRGEGDGKEDVAVGGVVDVAADGVDVPAIAGAAVIVSTPPTAVLPVPDITVNTPEEEKVEAPAAVEAVSPVLDVEAGGDVEVVLPSVEANASLESPDLPSTPDVTVEGSLLSGGVEGNLGIPDNQEVVVVMNEGTSEEDETSDVKKEDTSEDILEDVKNKSKKGRFKMPSLNFHMPKFGGTKKSYKVDTEANGKIDDIEAKINGVELGDKIQEDHSHEVNGQLSLQAGEIVEPKLDAEMNAGGGDISVEPENVDLPAVENKVDNSVDVVVTTAYIPDAGVSVNASASPNVEIEKPTVDVDPDAPVTLLALAGNVPLAVDTKVTPSEPSGDVQLLCAEAPDVNVITDVPLEASIEIPHIEPLADIPSVSVTVDDPQAPAVDHDASVKAKKKGLSLPSMHFNRPKLTGKKWSRHPRFKSKAKGNKSLGASGKVTTSLPDVAVASSSEVPDLKARRASDIIDPKVAAEIAAEHEFTAGGDVEATPGKSKKSRFKFPNLHFSLPRFSSRSSPNKAKMAEEVEPEMTELKAPLEVVDVTAEADIPKTNLDVVMPEISAGSESAPESNLEGAVGGVGIALPDSKAEIDLDTNAALVAAAAVSVPEAKLDANLDVPCQEVAGNLEVKADVPSLDGPDISTKDCAVGAFEGEIEAKEVDITVPEGKALEVEVPDVDRSLGVDVTSPEVAVDGDVELPSSEVPSVSVESPPAAHVDAGASVKKNRMRGFFPNMHLPKIHMKSPMKFKSKGKKGVNEGPSVEALNAEGEAEVGTAAQPSVGSPSLSMVVNTSDDPNVSTEGGIMVPSVDAAVTDSKEDCTVELAAVNIDAGADVEVKKSEIDVVSPLTEANVSVDNPLATDTETVNVNADAKISTPDVNTSADLPVLDDKADGDFSLLGAGTVVISYDTVSSPEVEEPKVATVADMDAPDINIEAGATNQVLDLTLGSSETDLRVDGNAAELTIESDNEEREKKPKKKKKRKGLHMPSINLPKFSLRQDKKVSTPPKLDVGGGKVEIDKSAEISMPDVEVKPEISGEVAAEAPGSSSPAAKGEPPSVAEAAAVVAGVALEVSSQEIDVPSSKVEAVDVSADVPVVPTDKDTPAISPTPETLDAKANIETNSIDVDAVTPQVECVVESVIPSVSQALTETVPDMATNASASTEIVTLDAEAASPSVPQAQVSVESPDADIAMPDLSTSKSPKSKKSRMPKMNIPKMNFKFPHKGGTPHHAQADVDGVTVESSLSPAEIEKIEDSLPSAGQVQGSTPDVEVNGVGPETPEAGSDVTPSSKKGKYRRKIGGKLKKIRGKGKGKMPVAEDIKGEGLRATSEVSLDGDMELSGDGNTSTQGLNVTGEESCLSATEGAKFNGDVSLDSDSPLLHANDLITSTPLKASVAIDGKLCQNNSAQAATPSPEPSNTSSTNMTGFESMNLDAAVAIHSTPASPEAISPVAAARDDHAWEVVVAIDFGTTFSGYAYSMRREPDEVHIMRKWEGGDPGVTNMKTPTTLLLTPEGHFHSFGFTARDFYHDMDHKEALRWLYFDKFKLTLHGDPELNLKTQIAAANGQSFPAVTVFEHSLRFFHDHALEELCDQSSDGEADPSEIRWVLTVPAIWKQPAKQFMRQAAYKAGLASPSSADKLLIALEPEAASIYIRKLRLRELAPEHQSQRQQWLRSSAGKLTKSNSQVSESIRHGTRYMVVDCGGGTVDITVHEVEAGRGTLKELHKAAGGRYGSVSIDQEFEQLLVKIVGQDFIDEFKIKRPAGWVDLMIAFEARKRNASPWKNNPLNVSLPFSFIDYYKKYKGGKQVEDAVRKYNSKEVVWSAQGMLRFTPEGMQQLFRSTVDRLVSEVDSVLSAPSLTGITHLFVVGGFAQSALLQSAIREKFAERLRIVIPRDLGLSILKGAVLFGMDPGAVRVRRSRLTYGVGVLNKYRAGFHPEAKRVEKDGVEWCKDIFDTFVQADESVAIGDKVTRSYTPAKPSQQAIIINIYCSDRENVGFITDEGVHKCGTLHIDVTDSETSEVRGRRELQLTMQYGDTEIKVSALDVPTGKCVKSSIDFLNK